MRRSSAVQIASKSGGFTQPGCRPHRASASSQIQGLWINLANIGPRGRRRPHRPTWAAPTLSSSPASLSSSALGRAAVAIHSPPAGRKLTAGPQADHAAVGSMPSLRRSHQRWRKPIADVARQAVGFLGAITCTASFHTPWKRCALAAGGADTTGCAGSHDFAHHLLIARAWPDPLAPAPGRCPAPLVGARAPASITLEQPESPNARHELCLGVDRAGWPRIHSPSRGYF